MLLMAFLWQIIQMLTGSLIVRQQWSDCRRGDGISNLNPDDIESIKYFERRICKCVIWQSGCKWSDFNNNKKRKSGSTNIDFSSSLLLNRAAYKPELQNEYGQTSPGATQSWETRYRKDTIIWTIFSRPDKTIQIQSLFQQELRKPKLISLMQIPQRPEYRIKIN